MKGEGVGGAEQEHGGRKHPGGVGPGGRSMLQMPVPEWHAGGLGGQGRGTQEGQLMY